MTRHILLLLSGLAQFLFAHAGYGQDSLATDASKPTQVQATLTTSYGDLTIELYAERAPITVSNFVSLARKGFYNGLIFHRIVPGFVIQGGDPMGNGVGGPGYKFQDEFHAELKHSKKGILSMANSGPNTNGSQFFITLSATPHLDGRHSVFGEVTKGLEVLDQIAKVERGAGDKPKVDVVIKNITITGEFSPVDFPKTKTVTRKELEKVTQTVAQNLYDALAKTQKSSLPKLGKLQSLTLVNGGTRRDLLWAAYRAEGSHGRLHIHIEGKGGVAGNVFTVDSVQVKFLPLENSTP